MGRFGEGCEVLRNFGADEDEYATDAVAAWREFCRVECKFGITRNMPGWFDG